MRAKKVIKAVAVMIFTFSIVMISLVFLNPDGKIRNFIFQKEKDTAVESSYEVSREESTSKESSSSNKGNSSKDDKASEEDGYANQILDKTPTSGLAGDSFCNACGGSGKRQCSACSGAGISSNGSLCNICYGNGTVDCSNCNG